MTVENEKDEVTAQREKQEKKAKSVLELRQELRNGRTTRTSQDAGGASQNDGGVSGAVDTEKRTTLQAPGRTSKRLAPTGGPIDTGRRGNRDNGRSPKAESERVGSGDRRFSENNGGPASHSEADERPGGQRHIGRLETDESIILRPNEPPATFEGQGNRKVPAPAQGVKEDYYEFRVFGKHKGYTLRGDKKKHITIEQWEALPNKGSQQPNAPAIPKSSPVTSAVKETIADGNVPWFRQGQTLSKSEAEALSEPLMAAIQDDLHYLDELLWLRYPHGAGKDIWGYLDDDEAGVLTRMLLKRAQQSPAAASTVRAIVDSKDYIATAEIIVPRAAATYRLVKTAPDRPRRDFSLFRKVGGQ